MKEHSVHYQGEEGRIELSEIYRILFHGRWFIVGLVLLAVAAALLLNSRMSYVYRATSTAVVVSGNPWETGLLLDSRQSVPSFSIADQLQILESRKLARQAVLRAAASQYADRLYLLGYPDDPGGYSVDRATERLLDDLAVKQVQNSNVLAISMEAPTGFEAAFLANTMAAAFYEQNQEFSRAEYTELTQFLKEQLDQVTARLQNAESMLTSFKEESRLSALDIETTTIVQQSAAAQAELNKLQLELQSNEVSLSNLKGQYSQGQSTLVEDLETLSTATIDQMTEEIATKQAQIVNVRARGEAGWEDYVRRLEDELLTMKRSLKEETRKISVQEMKSSDPLGTMQSIFERIIDLEVENKALYAAIEAQQVVVDRHENRLSRLPEASLEYVRFSRQVEINEKLYRLLVEKYQENQAVAAGMIGNVRLLDEAEVPGDPVRPNKRLNMAVAILLGLLGGVAASFVYHMFDTRIITPEDMRHTGQSVVGSIPTINVRKLERALRKDDGRELSEEESWKVKRKLITYFSPKSPISEAYRSLRTSLLMKLDKKGRDTSTEAERAPVIMVTSSTTQEGKSLTSANLAVAVAQTGRRTILIDADMRRPTAHKNFAVERAEGLSNVLLGTHSPPAVVSETDIEHLDVLSAGPIPSNPAELLGYASMLELIDWARENYSFVIVDTPPVVPVTDPTVVSRLVDGVILVVRSSCSHRRELNEALSKIRHADSTLLGIVLNDYDLKRVYGSYYYYYHYYDRYYYYGDRKKKRRRRSRGGIGSKRGERRRVQA